MNQRLGRDVIRFRRAARIGRTLLIISAAWTTLMVFSAFRWFGYVGPGWLADVGDGTLYLMSWSTGNDNYTLRGWYGGPNKQYGTQAVAFTWWQWGNTPPRAFVGLPVATLQGYSIWPVAPIAGISGSWILLSLRREHRRRVRLNLCLACAYQLPDGRGDHCPECATPVPHPAPTRPRS